MSIPERGNFGSCQGQDYCDGKRVSWRCHLVWSLLLSLLHLDLFSGNTTPVPVAPGHDALAWSGYHKETGGDNQSGRKRGYVEWTGPVLSTPLLERKG